MMYLKKEFAKNKRGKHKKTNKTLWTIGNIYTMFNLKKLLLPEFHIIDKI